MSLIGFPQSPEYGAGQEAFQSGPERPKKPSKGPEAVREGQEPPREPQESHKSHQEAPKAKGPPEAAQESPRRPREVEATTTDSKPTMVFARLHEQPIVASSGPSGRVSRFACFTHSGGPARSAALILRAGGSAPSPATAAGKNAYVFS